MERLTAPQLTLLVRDDKMADNYALSQQDAEIKALHSKLKNFNSNGFASISVTITELNAGLLAYIYRHLNRDNVVYLITRNPHANILVLNLGILE